MKYVYISFDLFDRDSGTVGGGGVGDAVPHRIHQRQLINDNIDCGKENKLNGKP